MTLASSDFDYIRDLVHRSAAIVVEPGKEYLAESRLLPIARDEGFRSLEDLVARLRAEPTSCLHRKVVEAMATNETSFFRDGHPFEALRKIVLPDLVAKRAAERRLHIWCGACSSGQEPYSIAMLVSEYFPALASWTVRIVASDLSGDMLARGSAALYSQLEVNRGVPATLLAKYFQKHGAEWQIKQHLRQMVEFREINLAEAWPALPNMDVVFIRNVLIYFDVEAKRTVLHKVRRLLRPGGYLFLGAAETTLNLDDSFERAQFDKAACYRVRAR